MRSFLSKLLGQEASKPATSSNPSSAISRVSALSPGWHLPLASLPPPERLARICDLLSTAVVRDWASQAFPDEPRPTPVPALAAAHAPATPADRIVAYLALTGQAGMSDLRETLGLPKMQAYRASVALIATGRIVATGRSHQTRYALSPAELARSQRN